MPSSERDESRDRELVLKHQPSFSDSGRASVPMYANPIVPQHMAISFLLAIANSYLQTSGGTALTQTVHLHLYHSILDPRVLPQNPTLQKPLLQLPRH